MVLCFISLNFTALRGHRKGDSWLCTHRDEGTYLIVNKFAQHLTLTVIHTLS